jgi:hypothetical protein
MYKFIILYADQGNNTEKFSSCNLSSKISINYRNKSNQDNIKN